MNKSILLAGVIVGFYSCQKNVTNNPPTPPKVVKDSLLIYQVNNGTTNKGIFSKSLTTGDSTLLVANATMPFVANQRMVFIKSGKTIGYARLNGVSKFLIELNAPTFPCLSLDARLISVVDKSEEEHQLIVLDTLGNKTILYSSTEIITQPEFSNDGIYLYFISKREVRSSINRINISTKETKTILTAPLNEEYSCVAATTDRLYFLKSMDAGEKNSTEICSVTADGQDFKQHTNFSSNWTVPGIKIEQLRDINNSSLVFVSDYNNNNKEIFVAKADNFNNHTRLTFSDTFESFPSLVPDFVKDF